MTITEINDKIRCLKVDYENAKGTEAEVYTRIVGYYRKIKNWNPGKRKEYDYRLAYAMPDKLRLKER